MEFLKKEFHKILARELNANDSDIKACMLEAFKKAEEQWHEIATSGTTPNKSGATCTAALIIGDTLWCAHVGDSPCYVFEDKGKPPIRLTDNHHPDEPKERERIEAAGGSVLSEETLIHKALCFGIIPARKIRQTARVMPGKIAVSRSIGDIKTKLEKYGGKPGCVSSVPDVTSMQLTKTMKAIVLFSDGIVQGVVDQAEKSKEKVSQETDDMMKALQKNFFEYYIDGYKDIKNFGNIASARKPKDDESKMQYLTSRCCRDFLDTGVARGGVEHKNQDNTTVVLGINIHAFPKLPPFED